MKFISTVTVSWEYWSYCYYNCIPLQ